MEEASGYSHQEPEDSPRSPLAGPGVIGAPLPKQDRLSLEMAVAREVLSELDALNVDGQRLIMERVVVLVEGWIPRVRQVVGVRNCEAIESLVDQLRQESLRICPSAAVLRNRAESVIALLTAAR